jgi:hypothetical protein
MTVNNGNRPSLVINWAARILGLIVLVFFLMILIGEMVTAIQDEGFEFDVESLYVILPTIIALTGYILGWWHKITGGSLLIFVSIVFGILTSVSAWQHQTPWSSVRAFVAWSIIGLPFLVIGALYLISAYLDRKTAA